MSLMALQSASKRKWKQFFLSVSITHFSFRQIFTARLTSLLLMLSSTSVRTLFSRNPSRIALNKTNKQTNKHTKIKLNPSTIFELAGNMKNSSK